MHYKPGEDVEGQNGAAQDPVVGDAADERHNAAAVTEEQHQIHCKEHTHHIHYEPGQQQLTPVPGDSEHETEAAERINSRDGTRCVHDQQSRCAENDPILQYNRVGDNWNGLTRRQFSRRFEPELINRQPVHVLGYIILLLGHIRPQQRIHVLGMPETQEHEEQDKGAHQLKLHSYIFVLGPEKSPRSIRTTW